MNKKDAYESMNIFVKTNWQILFPICVRDIYIIKPSSATMTDSIRLRKRLNALIKGSSLVLTLASTMAALNNFGVLRPLVGRSLDDASDSCPGEFIFGELGGHLFGDDLIVEVASQPILGRLGRVA